MLDRKKLVIFHWLLAMPTSLVCFLARAWWHIFFAIMFYNISGIGATALDAYVATSAKDEKMMRTFTVLESAYYVPSIVFPLVGAFILTVLNINKLFAIAFVVSFFSGLMLLFISSQKPAKKDQTKHKFYGYINTLINREFLRWIPVFFLIGLSIYVIYPFIPPFLEDIYLLTLPTIMELSAIIGCGLALLAVLFGWIADRFGAENALVINLGVVSFSIFLLLLKGTFPLLLLALFLFGGISVLGYLCMGIIGKRFKSEYLGATFAIYTLIVYLGGTIGAYLGGVFYEKSPNLSFIIGGLLPLCIMPLILLNYYVGKRE